MAVFLVGASQGRAGMAWIAFDQCANMAPGSVSDRFGSQTGVSLLDAYLCSLMYLFEQIFSVPAGRAVSGTNSLRRPCTGFVRLALG